MASQEFTVLYTHQKMKKSKTWQDGILRIRTGGNKAILFDDKGQCLESIFIKSQVNVGDNLESERYLITVEAVKVNEKCFEDQPRKAETPAVDRNGVKSGVLPPRHLSVGLKRKFTGFQGPRQVEKKISTMEDGENPTILPLSKHCQGTFPSKFYVTSPLFSTICKKDAETNLSADFHEDVRTDNDGEHTSLSSLLSAPFLGRCEETERQNSDRSIVKPESPPVTGHTKSSSQTAGHGAVSCNIRSTAQIIALLESKPTQGCRDQTSSEVTECLFRSQASENADSLYRQKPSILPAFSGNPAKRLIQNIQHLPFTKGTVNDKKEWNAEMLLNSAEQPCDKEATGQRHDKKAYNLSQDLQDPCNTNSCFLPESTRSRRSDSQFVPSSGDVSCSVSPITFEKNLSRYREDSSVKLQSELQPRQNSERIPSDQELSVDVTLTKIGFVKEELSMHGKDCGPDEQVMEVNFNLMEAFDFNDTDNEDLCERDVNKFTEGDMLSQSPRCLKGEDVAQNAALRLHSCCEVVTHSKNEEVKCSTFDGENGGNNCTEGIPSQLCDNDVGDTGRTAEDSANQTRIEVELLGNGHNVRETNDSQLSIEATNNKKDIDGCAAHTIDGTSWINSKHSDLLPGDTNVNECPPKTSMFEKTESISCISTSRIISAMDKRTEEDVQLECIKSPDVDLEHFWGTRSDDIKPGSPLLALSQKSEPSYGSFQYITEGHQKPNCVDNLLQKTIAVAQRDPRTLDCQPKSPGSRSLHEDDINFIRQEKFQKKSNIIKESRIDQPLSAMNVYSEVPPQTMSGSPSRSDLRQMQWTSWEPDKMISSVELTSSLDPDSTISPASGSEETVRDIQEPLIHRILPSEPELAEIFFTREKPSYPEEGNFSRFKPTVKTRTPFVTLPATEKISDAVYPTDREQVQRSFGSSAVHLGNKSPVFPISAFGPEDRNYETSVFGEYMEDRERESVQPVFPNVTAQYRQSKWLKYQNSAQCDLITQNSDDGEVTDDICAEDILGMPLGDTGESSAVNKSAPGSTPLLTAKSMLGKRCANTSNQDLISERKLLSLHLSQTPLAEATQKVLSHLSCHTVTGDGQDITISELSFPNVDKVKYANLPKRKVSIPTVFQSHVHYKQIFKAALTEQLNIMLFDLSQRLHNALSKVDISFHTSLKDGQSESKASCVPLCNHMQPAKLVTVKKEGQNKGRLFYTCDAPKAEQCSFFKWIEDVNPTQIKSRPSVVLHDIKSIGTYLRSQKISLCEGCQLLVRKAFEIQTQRCRKFKKMMNTPARFDGDSKTKLYLKLSRKEHYSLYSKDDIWVVSKTLNFDPLDTFIACSAFFGPSSNNEVELLPLKGYCPSNWRSNTFVHALLVCNASGELTSLRNMEEHFNPSTLPLVPYLLKMNFDSKNATSSVNKRKFIPPAISLKRTMMYGPVSTEVAMGLAKKMIQTFSLNPDQATSLIQIAQMMTSCENIKPVEEHQNFPITIIRGVFGAGKSYLLSVVILFLVQLFESSEAMEGPRPAPWKLLIASSTNVAVDRILLGLLDLGFEDFIRVGSIRKITKAILPHSLHAGSGNENEQLKELLALMKEDLTPVEKIYVRKSIEQHKLGTNKTILQQVKVVGVTCAACPFPCLNTLKFPVVMLDECSQMTEPASLLPIARFQCEKLVLVGDPKQLPPTIQGSESVHENGLEQTLFDRLCLMGHKPILLRTQYRCHPAISAIANELFYEGNLIDGVSEKDRSPLLDWLPTLCFYSVNGVEQIERDNSFYNVAEVHFTVKLIQSLIASGIEGSAIGVITLYKSQMCKVCIQNLLSGVHSEAFEIKAVQVSTVDAFQGAEKEIIVLSCVRTRQIGFIDSEKRMNVALTRAKRHLLIVGNLACLSRNRLWGRVIHHCKGWENGLQHVSQCEQQLNNILKCYLEKRKEKEQNKKKEK
ncbi:protein ZGRF1 isoform X2 [Aquila chrysaetos chrysaetos]|uniref:protein ZGRF1 isoform X2 n=1 Tax=Aquila chrysaetos chrysaetos TaxID=223781 RepID=UPI001B7D4448|nr:protein ZGRF1 isoform X2 [Aquila chrysaetos chrysaetos]